MIDIFKKKIENLENEKTHCIFLGGPQDEYVLNKLDYLDSCINFFEEAIKLCIAESINNDKDLKEYDTSLVNKMERIKKESLRYLHLSEYFEEELWNRLAQRRFVEDVYKEYCYLIDPSVKGPEVENTELGIKE